MIIHAVLVVEPQEERRVNDIHRERRNAQRPLGRHGCPRLHRVRRAAPRTLVDMGVVMGVVLGVDTSK